MALSVVVAAGIFVSMVRLVMVVLTVLAFAALTWATGLFGDVVRGWMPAILTVTGGWGFFAALAAFLIALYILERALVRREQDQRYAATGVIEIEKPHPWPMWLRVLAFAPLAAGMVAVIIAASNGK